MTSRALLQEREAAPPFHACDSDESAAIGLQLQRLLESPGFRTSRRCRLFLEHVIKHSLTPGAAPLKERALGMQVFGRAPSYDTAADPIVRVTAGEIRRRLGQYYADPAHQRELRVDIPAGSYTPTYIWPATDPRPSAPGAPGLHPDVLGPDALNPHGPSVEPALPAATWWKSRKALGIAGLLGALALLGALTIAPQPSSPFDRFWAPLIHSKVPVLLCTGSVDFYELPGRIKRAADGLAAATAATNAAAAATTAGSVPASPAPDGSGPGGSGPRASAPGAAAATNARVISRAGVGGGPPAGMSARGVAGPQPPPELVTLDVRDVRRVGAGFVSVADAVAIVRVAALFQEHGTPYQVREKRATSFADLRTSPTVLIGMFSNAWTLKLGSEFRFVPVLEGGNAVIRDRQHPDRHEWRVDQPWPTLTLTRDYALVSRVLDPVTGMMVVIGAGITPFGTTAATEFLTSPQHLEAALRNAPRDWPTRNLQIVLETLVIDGAATPPRVLATHVW